MNACEKRSAGARKHFDAPASRLLRLLLTTLNRHVALAGSAAVNGDAPGGALAVRLLLGQRHRQHAVLIPGGNILLADALQAEPASCLTPGSSASSR